MKLVKPHPRKDALRVLVGSHNYNLDDESSDRDYKVFVYPNFDDLYDGKFYSKSEIKVDGNTDCEWHDIRKLPMLIEKANINYIEVMFSRHKECAVEEADYPQWYKFLVANKEALATSNLKTFHNACWGIHHSKMKQLLKGTSGTQHLVQQYGYDTKQAMHAMRVILSLFRFKQTESMQETLSFQEGCGDQSLLLDIKGGIYSLLEFECLIAIKALEASQLEKWYCEQPKNDSPKELARLIKEEIRKQL